MLGVKRGDADKMKMFQHAKVKQNKTSEIDRTLNDYDQLKESVEASSSFQMRTQMNDTKPIKKLLLK